MAIRRTARQRLPGSVAQDTTRESSPTYPNGTPAKRVAVIGSGLAGLTTAYLLRQQGATVYLIEKADRLGFHSSSVDVLDDAHAAGPGDEKHTSGSWTVDVPMRSFQGGYYPRLIALYRHLGIPLQATHYTFSFAHLAPSLATSTESKSIPYPTPPPHFIHSGASGHSIPSLPAFSFSSPFALIKGVITLIAYAGCYLFLLALSFLSYHSILPCLFSGTFGDTTRQISEFLASPIRIPYLAAYTPFGRIWLVFTRNIVVPLLSSVGTMPEDEVFATPAKHLLDYIHKTVGTDHYTPGPGFSAREIANRLAKPVKEQGEGYVLLGRTVSGLKVEQGEVMVEMKEEDEGVKVDRVVLATPASVAMSLLGMLEASLTPESGVEAEKEIKRVKTMRSALKKVRYKETIVITHRDSSILPPNNSDIRDINLIHPLASSSSSSSTSDKPRSRFDHSQTPHFDPQDGYAMATHVIFPPRDSRSGQNSAMQGARQAVYQTTNPCLPIDPSTVLGTALLERALPLSNPKTMIPALHPPAHGVVYIAGSYAHPGIPLLEGCVGSAKRVVDSLIRDLDLNADTRDHGCGEREREMGSVDWSRGRGGLVGRLWRWRSRDPWGMEVGFVE